MYIYVVYNGIVISEIWRYIVPDIPFKDINFSNPRIYYVFFSNIYSFFNWMPV